MLTELPHSPAADRNKGPLLQEMKRLLPAQARVLEVASGTGQHAAYCAAQCPAWFWQPSEAAAELLPVIAARCADQPRVAAPMLLNALVQPWPDVLPRAHFDALLCVNLLHISAWPVCAALMQAAVQYLLPQGLLLVYGPFVVPGEPLAASNQAFDVDLRARNPQWGLRRLVDVERVAKLAGLVLTETLVMPANNLSLVFRLNPAAVPG
jgi:SAM-dependent methyltransferase